MLKLKAFRCYFLIWFTATINHTFFMLYYFNDCRLVFNSTNIKDDSSPIRRKEAHEALREPLEAFVKRDFR